MSQNVTNTPNNLLSQLLQPNYFLRKKYQNIMKIKDKIMEITGAQLYLTYKNK